MNHTEDLQKKIWGFLKRYVPRILTQMDRDTDSPTFGSFDRNFWHYKIRDFSSMVLQQAVLILDTLYSYSHPENEYYNNPLVDKWIGGALNFWASQQLRNGSFNEYYPYEAGYPPTAFSLYAVCLILKKRGFPAPEPNIQNAIQRACDWLLKHPEKEALNQEAAGLCSLALASRIPGIDVDAQKLETRFVNFFDRQSIEGWFPEYGGADLGYLSVTIDCLWDYFEATGDERALKAMDNAIKFIAIMVTISSETPVMINSRNTGYIVPYGIVKMGNRNEFAAALVDNLFQNISSPNHYLSGIDDRYACHYIFQSCFRSLPNLSDLKSGNAKLPQHEHYERYFEDSGILVIHVPGKNSIYSAGKKGGVIYTFSPEGVNNVDFGWRLKHKNGSIITTHWQDSGNIIDYSKNESGSTLKIYGNMSVHGWVKNTPMKHVLLRGISFIFRNKIIPLLKKMMIFKNTKTAIHFERIIRITKNEIEIGDIFKGENAEKALLYRAPHYSMRHVASACNYTPEELLSISTENYIIEKLPNKIAFNRKIKLSE